jgi:hypothetical protein
MITAIATTTSAALFVGTAVAGVGVGLGLHGCVPHDHRACPAG